jgi:malonyl-CoA/methylmalonyl-CoA synthetase
MADPGPAYVSGTLGTWLNRSISIPLCLTHPDRELSYVLEDSGASAVLASKPHLERMRRLAGPLQTQVIEIGEDKAKFSSSEEKDIKTVANNLLAKLQPDDGALFVYTSGTTGRPKGAVHTYKSLDAQINALRTAWEISSSDNILHTLPLHHIHGIVNALYCPLASGATVTMLPKFSPTEVWKQLVHQDNNSSSNPPINILMGVPTMYSFLLNLYHNAPDSEKIQYETAVRKLRIAISGSSACPTPIMHAWSQLTNGELLLERYGMTETGMLLGNPLHGERTPGTVGVPFPGIQVRIDPATGELGVRGDQLFAGYWQRPDATHVSFDKNGYFLTGDTAEQEKNGNNDTYYKLLGRTSVDIIKHGGYKISALEIESVVLGHPRIAECAVVGLPDQQYGEVIAVIASLKQEKSSVTAQNQQQQPNIINNDLNLADLLEWARDYLPSYQLPRVLHIVPQIPRNAMGKVNKKTLRAEIFPDLFPQDGPNSSSSSLSP